MLFRSFQHPDHRAIWHKAHQGDAIDWDHLFEGYQASVDWPSCNLWREQMAQYPDARVILSLRDPDKWYESVMATIYKSSEVNRNAEDELTRQGSEWVWDIIWQGIFDDRMADRERVLSIYNEHNARVQREVPPEKLLVFEASQGWGPLCEFLDVAVPEGDYPRVNSTEEFNQRWQGIRENAKKT